MQIKKLTIWCNAEFEPSVIELLQQGLGHHQLILNSDDCREADIAFGQPPAPQIIESQKLQWVQITSAGYTPYDNEAIRAALKQRGTLFTNCSHVYDEPCAQHVLAMMLALSRQLLPCYEHQLTDRSWDTLPRRTASFLLQGQTVLLLGFGAIARRLAEMLAPFDMRIIAVRKHPSPADGVEVVGEDDLPRLLPLADHVVNALPASPSTLGFVNAQRLGAMKRGAYFYNIGRGNTVVQEALLTALQQGPLGAAYLDVTDPEPLPPEHPLWVQPNCFITPHSAGGHQNEYERIIRHFLHNLQRFEAGEPLVDRILGT